MTVVLVAATGKRLVLGAAKGDKPRRFKIEAYDGGPLPVEGFDQPVIVDLATLNYPESIPILIDHTASVETTLGSSDKIENDGSRLRISGVVTATSKKAIGVVEQHDKGQRWQASIGVRVGTLETVSAGAIVNVNGQQFSGPVLVARDSSMYETSVLPAGADWTTQVNLAASAASKQKGAAMPTFEEWVATLGADLATLDETSLAALTLAYDAMQNPAPAPPVEEPVVAAADEPEDEEEDVKAETATLQASMRKTAGAELRRTAEIQAKATGHPLIAAKAIEDGWSIEKVELEVLKASTQATRPTSFSNAQNAPENLPNVLEAAVCVSRGIKDVEKQFDDKTLQAAHSQYRRGVGLQQLLIQAAVANGMPISAGVRINSGNLREVLQYSCGSGGNIQASFSTLSLPGLLSNVANKELLQGFMEEEQTWREVARVASVSDFKTVTSYRMLDDMEYEKLGPGGQIKHGTTGEESYTRQAATYAKMSALTRTDIINDDMGALDDLRNRVGRGGAKKLNRVFWTAWLSGVDALFTAGNGNLITGSTTTLLNDMVGLGLALDAFDDLRTPTADGAKVPGGKFGGTATILLTPGGGISRVAETIYVNNNLGGETNSNANIHAGKYKPVKSVFLNDSSVPGGSALAWYLLRNPVDAAGAVVSFLNGVEEPTVENADADFNTLGIQFRGYHDFGVDAAEFLCGVKSKGAA